MAKKSIAHFPGFLNLVLILITIHLIMEKIKKVYNRSPRENGNIPRENRIIFEIWGYNPVLYQFSIKVGYPDRILIATYCSGSKMAKMIPALFFTG